MRFFAIMWTLLFAGHAAAFGGVLEINQTCAVESGCFAGDTAGFPVTIPQPGSYRLTSNLSLATDVDGILIESSSVTVDLGGFEIAGPGVCTGTGATLSCGATGAGVGVVGRDVLYSVTVRNGIIRNMRLDGIGVGGTGSLGVRIEGITARHNARIGISGQDGVLARDCVAIENGGNGFDLDAGSSVEGSTAIGNFGHGVEIDDAGGVVSGTTSRSNAGRGFNVVAGSRFGKNNVSTANGAEDSCGGGICTDRKRFYLTAGGFDESAASGACDDGFHYASIWELEDVGRLQYDGSRATAVAGVNSGPPNQESTDGRVRAEPGPTGISTKAKLAGRRAFTNNPSMVTAFSYADFWPCRVFSKTTATWPGSADDEIINCPALTNLPWLLFSFASDFPTNVWCVED